MDGARWHLARTIPKGTVPASRRSKKLTALVSRTVKSTDGRRVRLMFQDEGRFGRISHTYRCWAPPATRPRTGKRFIRQYCYVYAAVSPHDGLMDSLVLPRVGADIMSIFLAEVAGRHRDELILMLLDGAGWHRAKELVVPDNIRLVPLPPYSPELNPIEHLWDELSEKWFGNYVFDSLNAVEDRLVEALASLANERHRLKSMTAFPWIVNIPTNAT